MKRSTSTPRSERNIVGPDFDDGIIVEILLKLPAKSLLRCRCVCKSWRTLISDPSFVRDHLRRVNTSNNFNLLVETRLLQGVQADVISKQADGAIAITARDYPVVDSGPGYSVFYGSCNGLMCVQLDVDNMFIWNPLTREVKQLPEVPVPDGALGIYGEGDRYVALAGFGYDSTIEDYKVIRVTKVFYDETALQVYTLKTGLWRTNLDFGHISDSEYHTLGCSFLLKETLHWVAYLRGSEYEEGTMGIVTIGLAEEKFQLMMLLPFRYSDRWNMSSTVTVGNSLLVYNEFSIWMMKEYGVQESWTQIIYIHPEVLPQGFDVNLFPLCIFENGEVLLMHKTDLGLYNPEKKTFRNVIILDREKPSPIIDVYIETLVSPLNGQIEMSGTEELPPPCGWSKKGRRRERKRRRQQLRSDPASSSLPSL